MSADHHTPLFDLIVNDEPEEWRPIAGWPDYEVSDLGRVRSWIPWRGLPLPRLIGGEPRDDYVRITLCDRGRRRLAIVSHLVMETFVGPRPAGMIACHAPDPDKTNNRLDNLRWATPSENNLDQLRAGSVAVAKLTESDIPAIWDRLLAGETTRQVADDYGVPPALIRRLRQKKAWSHITADYPELPSWRLPAHSTSGPIFIPEEVCLSPVELWAPIPGWPKYEASSFGLVRSFKQKSPRMLKFREHEEGYWCVALWQSNKEKAFLVQHLILMTFACPRPVGMEACHGDGDRKNNHAYNLRWDARPANLADRIRHRGFGANVKLTPEQVVEIRARIVSGESVRSVAAAYGVTTVSIRNIIKSLTWAHIRLVE